VRHSVWTGLRWVRRCTRPSGAHSSSVRRERSPSTLHIPPDYTPDSLTLKYGSSGKIVSNRVRSPLAGRSESNADPTSDRTTERST
jgi:hypothetical protein